MPVCVWDLHKVLLYLILVAKTTIKPLLVMSLQQKSGSETVEVNSFILIIDSQFNAAFFSCSKITSSGLYIYVHRKQSGSDYCLAKTWVISSKLFAGLVKIGKRDKITIGYLHLRKTSLKNSIMSYNQCTDRQSEVSLYKRLLFLNKKRQYHCDTNTLKVRMVQEFASRTTWRVTYKKQTPTSRNSRQTSYLLQAF